MRELVVYGVLCVVISAVLCLQVYNQILDNEFYIQFEKHQRVLEKHAKEAR